jgi:hypothetical protein
MRTRGDALAAMGKICDIADPSIGQVKVWINSNDHCDPHVHCGDKAGSWEGRIFFSFLDNFLTQWDCLTPWSDPGSAVFIEISRRLPVHLRQCRAEWWRCRMHDVGCCLANVMHSDVVGAQRRIRSATYETASDSTELTFTNGHTRRVNP